MKEYKTNIDTNGYTAFMPGKYDAVAAIRVSRWTRNAGTMLPKSPKEMLDLFTAGNSVLLKSQDGTLLGHAAKTATYSDGAIEVGSIYANENHRKHGVGTIATKVLLESVKGKNPDITLFALANGQSGPMFQKMGATEMKTTELSPEVWELCKTCPKLPAQKGETFMCCDTPYNLTGIVQK